MNGAIWKKPLVWALAASVVVNIFLGAAFLGRAFGGPPHHDFGPRGGVLGSYLREAPPEMRDVARRIEDGRREAFQAEREARRAAYGRMRELIRSEPFDRDGFRDAQAAAREGRARSQAISDEGVLELLSQMSVEDRRALADRMERRWRERRERWKEKDRDSRREEGQRPPQN